MNVNFFHKFIYFNLFNILVKTAMTATVFQFENKEPEPKSTFLAPAPYIRLKPVFRWLDGKSAKIDGVM